MNTATDVKTYSLRDMRITNVVHADVHLPRARGYSQSHWRKLRAAKLSGIARRLANTMKARVERDIIRACGGFRQSAGWGEIVWPTQTPTS
jgi:hypothetical protein